MPSASSRSVSPETRASLYQFTVYLPGAVSAVFLAIWLSEHGLPADQIGLVNSIPMLCLLAVNMVVGRLADRAKDWRTVIIIISLLGAAVPVGMFFVNEFWSIMLVWALCTTTNGLVPPLIDAATVRMTRRNGSDFGMIRAWATVGYVVGTGGLGLLITVYGASAFVPLYLAMSVLRAALGLWLPRFRAPQYQQTLADTKPRARLRDSLKLWFVLPLLAFALVNSSNAVIGGFAALLWHQSGIEDYFIGPLLAVAAFAEAILMFAWRRFGGRVTARNMILIASVAGLVRFTAMAFSPSVEILFLVQMLHALSFGLGYFGMVHFIANWTDEANAAEAQGFANMLQQGVSMVVLVIFGVLMERFGAHAFFFSTLTSLSAVACVIISLRLRPPRDAQ